MAHSMCHTSVGSVTDVFLPSDHSAPHSLQHWGPDPLWKGRCGLRLLLGGCFHLSRATQHQQLLRRTHLGTPLN